ncbi:arylamine N-acetyltransferase [Kibdelosporangium philippinense]|uniref:Arylamine N-acetyltransferase n=1 Tax=Kibdelosporangium philippinense TaxID=211113 RepID=A0ABS8ZPC2_9PSEU|nr:arylamine N-acetyltransferase [Kibdelosporangium philippinense]MCE7009584.1 arylamine N-acetyltransferase [Kibdelosporangium philippinense]
MTWGTEELDLDAYLSRIGVAEPTLKSVHAGHVASIPFENIEVFLGDVPKLDIPSLQAKLVGRERGGYCFEHNLLYTAALDRLGIPVQRLLARPRLSQRGGPMRGRTHMMAVAEVDGRQWLTDVGWGGGGLLEPMPFEEGTMRQGAWTFRLTRIEEQWVLQSLTAGEWVSYYGFTTERQYLADYEMSNFYSARAPGSHWTARLIAQRTGPEFRTALVGNELVKARPSGETEKRTLTAAEILGELPATFGIELTDAERDQVIKKI